MPTELSRRSRSSSRRTDGGADGRLVAADERAVAWSLTTLVTNRLGSAR